MNVVTARYLLQTKFLIIIGIVLIVGVIVVAEQYQNKLEWNVIMQDVAPTNTEQAKHDETVPSDTKVKEIQPVRMCAYIGFDKYPPNMFAEFLENPNNKDVTFLNFTHNDLKQVPEFYDLILEAEQMDYPLNDRVRFDMTTEEILKLKEYLEHRPYNKFTHSGKTLTEQTGTRNIDGYYRHPDILIDGNLYGINGLNYSPVVSGQTETLNVQLAGSLEDVKNSFIERNNPNNPGIYYFEVNEEDKVHLGVVLDAIDQIQKSKDKIHMSKDVGNSIQDKTQDFFMEQNMIQFHNNNNTKYTQYFILNNTLYETSFVIC